MYKLVEQEMPTEEEVRGMVGVRENKRGSRNLNDPKN